MLKRKVFRGVIKDKLLHAQFGWLARRAWDFASLKAEGRLGSGRSPAPLMAVLMVTENCNLRCPMCDLPERFRRDPSDRDTASWKLVLDQLAQLGAAGVGFTGGEPTVRKDIFELISHARGLGFPVTLNTNGLSLSDERMDALVASDPTNINISIDSGRDDVNDRLRGGRDVLQKALERIRSLVDRRRAAGKGYTVTVVTVLSDSNLNDLDVLFERAASAGADRIGFMPLHDIAPGRCAVAAFAGDTSGVAANIRALSAKHNLPVENSDAYLDAFSAVMSGQTSMPVRCNAGYTSIVIGPDFTLYRCWPYLEKRQTFRPWDPRTSHIKTLWNDAEYRAERLRGLACKECFWNCHAELSYLIKM